jgi:hypothetical protein
MARALITPLKVSAMTTAPAQWLSSAFGAKLATAGVYIKTGGTSRIDPSKLLFFVCRNSSKASSVGILSVVSGSTANNRDYQPGNAYSTLNNLNISLKKSTAAPGGISGRTDIQFFNIPGVARFCDTDNYIKFNVSTAISSKSAVSKGARMGAIYLSLGSH